MSNQASEDELKREIEDALWVDYDNDGEGHVRGVEVVVSIIRTEKLKLLTEVRGQTTIFKFSEVLNKLEAEL